MINKTMLTVLGALLLATNVQAAPQDAPKPMDDGKMKMDHAAMKMPATPEARAKMANTMFDKIDTDKNGSLSRTEFVTHHRNMSMDHGMPMDHGKHAMTPDGATMNHAAPAPSTASNTFQKLDSNKDVKLSQAEMAKHPMAGHFAMLDADKDGYLSPKEAAAHGL